MSGQDPYSAFKDALHKRPYEESEESFKRDITNRFHAFFDSIEKFNSVASEYNPGFQIKASIANISKADRTAIGWIEITHGSGTQKVLFTLYKSDIGIQDDEFTKFSANKKRRFHIDEAEQFEADMGKYLVHLYASGG